MYAFLLALGAAITAAGVALLASGISVQDHAFDAANVTPAMIAIIGGCILIGLAFVVRALLLVERALTARPMPRPARPAEGLSAFVPTAQTGEPIGIPFPQNPKVAPQSQPATLPSAVRPAVGEGAAPNADRLESAPVVEESDVSLLPKTPVRAEDQNGDANHGVAGRANGAAQTKTAPRVGLSGRPARRQQQQPQGSIFDSLWPRAQQPAPEAQMAAAAQAAPPPPASPPQPVVIGEHVAQAQPAPAAQPAQPSVSILKSGVVEGMAYTLYSDGSIEAQLPGGTLRFGSITELRNHIEQHG
jgi:hypothetical protein